MSRNQVKTGRTAKRTILYPKRIVVIIQHALGLPFSDALVIQRRANGSYDNFRLKASR